MHELICIFVSECAFMHGYIYTVCMCVSVRVGGCVWAVFMCVFVCVCVGCVYVCVWAVFMSSQVKSPLFI